MSKRDDELKRLIERINDGDQRAATELFAAIKQDVYRILVATVGPDSELDDMLQTAFMEIFRSLGRFKGNSKFTTWMYRLVVNVALQYVRKRKSRPSTQDIEEHSYSLESPFANPAEHAMQRQELAIVREILAELPPKKRLVFVLHEAEGHSPEEISEMLGISRFTVKSRLFYARKEFSRKLRQRAVLEAGRMTASPQVEVDDENEN